ncbi:unnamed protein product [Ilex paraguariensis]|uniref:Uncharacterized protein n=1 Tax=Ilex paraguariensis TaxID=185542 RepID=A0ABC8UE92_9AQUA
MHHTRKRNKTKPVDVNIQVFPIPIARTMRFLGDNTKNILSSFVVSYESVTLLGLAALAIKFLIPVGLIKC